MRSLQVIKVKNLTDCHGHLFLARTFFFGATIDDQSSLGKVFLNLALMSLINSQFRRSGEVLLGGILCTIFAEWRSWVSVQTQQLCLDLSDAV